MHYVINVPALESIHGVEVGPPVKAGEPIDPMLLYHAWRDLENRKGLEQCDIATELQVAEDIERFFRVGTQHVPPFPHSPLFVTQLSDQNNRQFVALREQFGHPASMAQEGINTISALMLNDRAKHVNAVKGELLAGEIPRRPLVKERPGIGKGLPGNFHRHIVPNLKPGDEIPSRFPPALVDALESLTEFQLDYLSRVWNNTFGITPDDSLEQKRRKYIRFVT